MSFDEKSSRNHWRFNKEITLGDLVIALGVLAAVLHLDFQVADHEKRLVANETALSQQAAKLAQHDTAIAVLEARTEGKP